MTYRDFMLFLFEIRAKFKDDGFSASELLDELIIEATRRFTLEDI